MPRMARVVAPGPPHHVAQRGNRRQETFFGDQDCEFCPAVMAEWCSNCGVEAWAKLQVHERTGRPLGGERFVNRLEKRLDRILRPQKLGRKPKPTANNRTSGK